MMSKRMPAIEMALGLLLLLMLVGCGKTVTVGNSAMTMATGFVSFSVDPIQELKFCVARIRLENEEEKTAAESTAVEESSYTQFAPGLIDVTSGAAQDWGSLALPEKSQVVRLKIKVKKDESLCGTSYSLSFNGLSTPRDIEFRWKFDPPIDVSEATKALRVSFDEIVSTLQASAMSDELQLKDRVESVEPAGTAE